MIAVSSQAGLEGIITQLKKTAGVEKWFLPGSDMKTAQTSAASLIWDETVTCIGDVLCKMAEGTLEEEELCSELQKLELRRHFLTIAEVIHACEGRGLPMQDSRNPSTRFRLEST